MKDSRTITIVSIIVSVILAAAVLVTVFLGNTSRELNCDIVIFGDSNIGNFRTANGPAGLLSKQSNMSVLNAGIGGSMMNNAPSVNCEENPWRYYSMVEMSKAVVNKDFTALKAEYPKYYVEFYKDNFDYLKETVDTLSKTDFSKVKTIIICHGLNDYLNGSRISDPNDSYNEETFAGALRTSIENLKKAAPDADIICIGPTYNKVLGDSDSFSTGHGVLPDYIAAEEEICLEYGVKFAALNGVINKDNVDDYLYDGMHVNDEGAKLLADLMLEMMNK